MNWLNGQIMDWEPPLHFASRFNGEDIALLHSGLCEQESGEDSYLFVTPLCTIESEDWDALEQKLSFSNDILPDWVGYLGYGLRERDARSATGRLHFPNARLVRYAHLFRFYHREQRITYAHRETIPALSLPAKQKSQDQPPLQLQTLTSNLTRAEYEKIITATIEQIHAGNFYQANITRKFFGECNSTPDSLSLFHALCDASPAAYSAYIRHGNTSILSASPECFLRITPDGTIAARPIKGSARREAAPKQDHIAKEALRESSKNRAENLMIVDLMRNDLARVSTPQSVRVKEHAALYSYSTIHHLISSIEATRRPDIDNLAVIRACFPPGSMTGAPKIAAVDWCTQVEPLERGIYSGAIGWINKDSCDLSVVIRTLILDGKHFEFQVGGGIVADSTPEEEWRETITKARGILMALGLDEKALEAL